MAKSRKIFKILWVVIAVIAVAAVIALILLPHWKGVFLAGMGGFLILNILISMFFIQNNYRDKR